MEISIFFVYTFQSSDNDETVSQLSSEMGRTGGDGAGIDDVPVWIILVSVAVGLVRLFHQSLFLIRTFYP